jgi:hypothetical protein
MSNRAKAGRDARYAGNSNRSIIRTRRVSDSRLKPAIIRGELSKVREVEIIGDVKVRIVGREALAKVSFD